VLPVGHSWRAFRVDRVNPLLEPIAVGSMIMIAIRLYNDLLQ